jgi:hypothetical protein
MIAVIAAHRDGKAVQCKYHSARAQWNDTENPVWSFELFDYRIKPEPLECWVNVYNTCLNSHWTEADAKAHAGETALRIAVHMKEVE